MTNWQINIARWLLKINNLKLTALPFLSAELQASAKEITNQTNIVGVSGEFKRAQALRALLNRHPEELERNCALAIELQICGVV